RDSMPTSTGWRASSSWPATPRSSTTCRTRRRRGATHTWRSARRTSAGSRGGRDRPRGLGERGTSADPGRERGPGGGGDGGRRAGYVWGALAALAGGLGLQIGVNFANDYQDGMRGIDTDERQGPQRLTSSGLASPRSVLLAQRPRTAAAGVAGLAPAVAPSLWLIPIGAAAMLALWFYSGGPRP